MGLHPPAQPRDSYTYDVTLIRLSDGLVKQHRQIDVLLRDLRYNFSAKFWTLSSILTRWTPLWRQDFHAPIHFLFCAISLYLHFRMPPVNEQCSAENKFYITNWSGIGTHLIVVHFVHGLTDFKRRYPNNKNKNNNKEQNEYQKGIE